MNKQNIIIKAVGDICPGDKGIPGFGVCSEMEKHGCTNHFLKIYPALSEADILIGNLEGGLSESHRYDQLKRLNFWGHGNFANTLKGTGFDILSVANNHSLEHGEKLFTETVRILNKAGIKVCGLRDENDYYSKPVIIEKKGYAVGFIAYNWVGIDKFADADKYIAQSRDSIVNYTWNRYQSDTNGCNQSIRNKNTKVIADIKKLRSECDIVVLMPHWGYEFVHYPPLGVVAEARSFIDAGADLIIGSHPHVLQGYEKYKNRWIVYSLGNFVFDMRVSKAKKTAVLRCEIDEAGGMSCEMTYARINKYFQPEPTGINDQNVIEKIIDNSNRAICSDKNTVLLNDDKLYRDYEKEYKKNKFWNVLYHFMLLPRKPTLLKDIIIKIKNFIDVVILKKEGKKVRW